MQNNNIIRTFDVDELKEVVQPWEVGFIQLTPGKFNGELEYANFDGIIIYKEQWSQKLHVNGSSPKGYFTIGTALSKNEEAIWCGESLNENNLAVSDGSSELEFVTTNNSLHYVMLIPKNILSLYLEKECIEFVSQNNHTLNCGADFRSQFISLISEAINKCIANKDILSNKIENKIIHSRLLGLAIHCIINRNHSWPQSKKFNQFQIVKMAIKYVEAKSKFTNNIPELAMVLGVSQRTLEYAFKSILGITPIKFLRWRRLNGMHKDLLFMTPSFANVTTIAMHWGFTEMGRVAADYHKMFGELPSYTLAKNAPTINKKLNDAF